MRTTYSDIYAKFLRNIQSVGVVDANITAEFNYQLGVYYQLMLAKLKNYKTYLSTPFNVGMNVIKLTSGSTAQAISSITSVTTTATVTTAIAHGYSTNDKVSINGCSPSGFTGTYTITVTSTTTFTYTLTASLNGASADHAQYYNNPPGYVTTDGMTLTVGQINYPLKLVSSQFLWEQKNIVPMQVAIPPQNYFPRRDDFGIWPIPRTLYTGHIYYHYRDRNLMVADYQAGSIALTQNSNAIVGTTTVFTAAMVGRWLEVTDTTVPGQGYWLRINSFTDTTHITTDSVWAGATTSGITGYRIGECPEIPEDLHMYLADGVTGGYLKDVRKDMVNGQAFLNSFFTGDLTNPSRKDNDENIMGGLIGGMKSYSDREDERIINRDDEPANPYRFEPWGVRLSSS